MSLENETRAEFAARMDKEGNSRADMIAAYYGLLQWYRGKDDELQESEAEVARLRAERDAARAAAARWRNRARFWRGEAWGWACEVFDNTQSERQWMAQFWKVTRRARRWQREGERHD